MCYITSMAKIALLTSLVADQIAAGEVVEHAASAVKELIENALDAGAQDIVVRIVGGGLERLSVEDDGCGMDREDAMLCLQRHATSKIRSVHDLEALCTMGFRGEALAALASISKLEIKTSDGKEACRVTTEGGSPAHIETIARNQGTTVEARNLFFNTPARLKFQKSASASSAAVLKVVQTIALAHPEVRFALYSNGKLTLQCFCMDWKKRAEEILGTFAHCVEAPMLHGLLGRPEDGKPNRKGQVLFINKRPVVSPLIAKAVKEGYGTRMQELLLPTFLLFLELPPEWIDVNVHPQKREVRFRDESHVYKMVLGAVFQTFEKSGAPGPMPWDLSPIRGRQVLDATEEVMNRWNPDFGKQWIDFLSPTTEPSFQLEEGPLSLPIEELAAPLAVLDDFLLVQREMRWQLVDLRGAEARIVFEEMEEENAPMQTLLWPIEYQAAVPEELVEQLKAARMEARIIGKQTIAIDAIPQNLQTAHVIGFLEELRTLAMNKRSVAAALTKTYRSAKRRYSLEEGALIWEKLGRCKDQGYDPIGKKIVSFITKEDLTRMFL